MSSTIGRIERTPEQESAHRAAMGSHFIRHAAEVADWPHYLTLRKAEGVQLVRASVFSDHPKLPYMVSDPMRGDAMARSQGPGTPVMVPWYERGDVVGYAEGIVVSRQGGERDHEWFVVQVNGRERGYYGYSLAHTWYRAQDYAPSPTECGCFRPEQDTMPDPYEADDLTDNR